ncbi:MAG: SMI1/KNR4 family protein [Gemmataceae bacterium]
MQKFTRSLTREIELHGERYAVTLNNQGLALRPVGSRKPPKEASWEQVAQWLGVGSASVESARSAVAAPCANESSVSELTQLLAQLDQWLQENRPAFHEGLAESASSRDLQRLAEVLGGPVPAELQAWLSWHNGQGDGEMGSLVGAFNLLSAAEMAEILREHQTQLGDTLWKAGWIPLLDDFQGDSVCVDSTQPGLPVLEVWSGQDQPTLVAPSLLVWVRQFLNDCRAGLYVEDPERGEFLRRS